MMVVMRFVVVIIVIHFLLCHLSSTIEFFRSFFFQRGGMEMTVVVSISNLNVSCFYV